MASSRANSLFSAVGRSIDRQTPFSGHTQSIFGLGFLESFPSLPHLNKLDRSFLLTSLATPFIACDHITGRVDVGGTYQMCSSPSSTCLDLSKLLDLSTPDFFFFYM